LAKFILFFLFISAFISQNYAQEEISQLKAEALKHMEAGRYGEAIDLLNKYISAKPRLAEGYNLRGLCYEARSQLKNAIIDLRKARKLAPNDKEINKNLARVREKLYKILRKNIVGYKRDIKIDPSIPWNYLEIGKAYRWMEEWELAEEWYDKYLELDPNASPDEIIRYVEILTANKHIEKGEKVLKKWVDKYPEDWRLWSRYGWFNIWLGRYKIAKEAFERALSFKPYFKEAQDGLDRALRQAYLTQEKTGTRKEYPIDRYYRLLRKDPSRDDLRFKLIDELIKSDRIEEAYQQLLILAQRHEGEPDFDEKWNFVLDYRDKVYRKKIKKFKAQLEKNPKNKKAAMELAQFYNYIERYDSAVYVYQDYLEQVPDENDPKFLYGYARSASWDRQFDLAIEIMDDLLDKYPDNLEYQLFRAQLAVWTNQDLDLAGEYLQNVLDKQPKNIDAIIAMGSYYLQKRDFDKASLMADSAEAVAPTNPEGAKLRSNIEFQRLRAEEERLYGILEEGRQLVMNDSCSEALSYYEDYLAQAEPNDLILKEYGDVLFCAGDYEKAKEAYEEVLSHGFMYEAALQSAKVSFAAGDSITALKEFKKLVQEEPEEFDPVLYLADSYAKVGETDSARIIYDNLLQNWELDSVETKMVKLRLGWLPITGIEGVIATFPSSVGFAPTAAFYGDNLGFYFYRTGGRLDLGVLSYLTLGVSFNRTFVRGDYAALNNNILINMPAVFTGNIDFTSFKGHIFVNFSKRISGGVGYGILNSSQNSRSLDLDAFVRYSVGDTLSITAQYNKSDADIILYSPYLIDVRREASVYQVTGFYKLPSTLKISGLYNYIDVSDGNAGNNIRFRLGKEFYPLFNAGYEYYYANFRFDAFLYYSPIGFESHSLWGEYYFEKSENLSVKGEAKIGYEMSTSIIVTEARAELRWKIFERLNLNASFSAGKTAQDQSTYTYNSGELSIYWTIY